MVKEGNLSPWINIIGPVPKKEVYKYLTTSDALIHIELELDSSKWGGSPNKIYDYLASGKPIIYCSNFVKEWLDKINCGLYTPPGNVDKLADTIVEIINMKPEEKAAMGERGRNYVEERNDISILSKEFLSLLNSVIGAEKP
jgi:glycosyltransferase involved in cell wall biosynthesis